MGEEYTGDGEHILVGQEIPPEEEDGVELPPLPAKVTALIRHEDLKPTLVCTVDEAVDHVRMMQRLVREVLRPKIDYGVIPGTAKGADGKDKKVLLLPGAQNMLQLFGYYARPILEHAVEEWDKEPPFFAFRYRVEIVSKRSGQVVGVGVGSANSMEDKYRYRTAQRTCPECGAATIFRSKFPDRGHEDEPPGWYCWQKKGGCGAKFVHDSENVVSQDEGRILNPETPSIHNTLVKMAKKRGLIDGTMSALGLAADFTQDLDDQVEVEEATTVEPQPRQARPVPQADLEFKPTGGPAPEPPPYAESYESVDMGAGRPREGQLKRLNAAILKHRLEWKRKDRQVFVELPNQCYEALGAPVPLDPMFHVANVGGGGEDGLSAANLEIVLRTLGV